MDIGVQDEQTDDRSVAVVGIDFSDTSRQALVVATNLSLVTRGLDIHLLHVLRPPSGSISGSIAFVRYEGQIAAAKQALETLAAKIPEHGSVRTFTHLRTGDVHREIVQLACDVDADLVIIGTCGDSGIARLLLGSIAEKVQRFAPCPVLTVKMKSRLHSGDIEQSCPFCRVARIESHGAEVWCEQHEQLVPDLPLAPDSGNL